MKHVKKLILILFVLGFLMIATILGAILLTERIDQSDLQAPYVVVLGAKLYEDRPSPVLTERLQTALQYLERFPDSRVIVSGAMAGNETITEAQAMKTWLQQHGIPEERIRVDETSRNTFENLLHTKQIITSEKGENRIAISTTGYHQFRAGFLAERLGLEIVRLPSRNPPSEILKGYSREILAVVKSFLFDHE